MLFSAPIVIKHLPREHAAIRTHEFLYHQLIPYIGNKRKLLPLIHQAILHTGLERGLFVDLFAGSGVVSRLAKTLGFRVVANDWEPYAREINGAYIGCNQPPAFSWAGGYRKVFEILNNVEPIKGYVTTYYCPRDDENPDIDRERLFFTRANGSRIDAMREKIAEWEKEGYLNWAERAFLLAPLIYSASYVSNTSGVFKGFHRGWGGQTGTALYRIFSQLQLNPPITFDNHQINEVYQRDAQKLAEGIECDIAYLDPPYNQHPYGSNYHLLNTITLWDKPPLNQNILIDGKTVNKSAIRRDWRKERRSAYNYKSTALEAFRRLVFSPRTKFILVSYSTDGIVPVERMVEVLAERGALTFVQQRYKRYRVSSQRYSHRSHNLEYVLIVDCQGNRKGLDAQTICSDIQRRAQEIAWEPNETKSEALRSRGWESYRRGQLASDVDGWGDESYGC